MSEQEDKKEVRVEFCTRVSSPPGQKTNNPETRKQNKDVREEVKLIMDFIEVGQSLKVFGVPYAQVSSMTSAIARKHEFSLTIRQKADCVQVWRAS